MVTKSKEKVAKKLGVPAKILVPVNNIIKVDDLERELAEIKAGNDKIIAENEKIIAEERKANAEKDEVITQKNKEIAELKKRFGIK